jgi:hypothetical protein
VPNFRSWRSRAIRRCGPTSAGGQRRKQSSQGGVQPTLGFQGVVWCITSAVLTLIAVGALCGLLLKGQPVPPLFWVLVLSLANYYKARSKR